jgi:hypothetical protein
MERFNGEVRDREKVMRCLKKKDTPILTGYQIFHNYVRPHMGLDGQTPAGRCGIKIEGDDRWLTLIQNGEKHQTTYYNKTKSSFNAFDSKDISSPIMDSYTAYRTYSRICYRFLHTISFPKRANTSWLYHCGNQYNFVI